MLLEKIEALRKEPKEVRNRYAFISALSVTLLVAVIWSISLPSRLNNPNVSIEIDDGEVGPSVAEQLSDLKVFLEDNIEDIKSVAELVETDEEQSPIATSSQATSTVLDSFIGDL